MHRSSSFLKKLNITPNYSCLAGDATLSRALGVRKVQVLRKERHHRTRRWLRRQIAPRHVAFPREAEQLRIDSCLH